VPFQLLILGYLPALPKTQYIAVCRAAGRVTRAAVILTIASTCEMVAVVIGGRMDGLVGLTAGLLVISIAEGLITAPAVFRTALGHGRHRRGAAAAEAPAGIARTRAAGGGPVAAARPATRSFPTVVPVTAPQRVVRPAAGPQPRFVPIEDLNLAAEKSRERERRQEVGLAVLMSLATTDPFRIPSRAHQAGPTFSFGPAEQLEDDIAPPEPPQPRRPEPPRRRKPPADLWADKV